jgi:cyanophycinase
MIGSGEYLPPIEPLDRYLLGLLNGPARVVCLPTAAGKEGPERLRYWSELGEAHFNRLGVESVHSLPLIDRASAHEPLLAEHIRRANFVYLSGGDPGYLFDTLAGSPAWAAVGAVLAAGGVLAGCSAGAMVQAGEFFGFPGWRKGFGLSDKIIVIPHFDEFPAPMLGAIRLGMGWGKTLVGVEANTALLAQNGHYTAKGAGAVVVLHGPLGGGKRYRDGELIEELGQPMG